MIVHVCTRIHLKDYGGWIIVMGFRVLLISQNVFREILVEAVFGVHIGGVNIKIYPSKCCNDTSSTQKVHGGIHVLECTRLTCNTKKG